MANVKELLVIKRDLEVEIKDLQQKLDKSIRKYDAVKTTIDLLLEDEETSNVKSAGEAEAEAVDTDNIIEFTKVEKPASDRAVRPYDGIVYKYSLEGKHLATYKNRHEAMRDLKIELGVDPDTGVGSSSIGYCCTGSYNLINPKSNHYKYKNYIWLPKHLTESERQSCFEKGIFLKENEL